MATEDEGTDDRTLYVLKGLKNAPGQRVSRVIVEGSTSDPKRVAVLDGPPVPLSNEEYKELSQRYSFRKAGEEAERKAAGADDAEDDTQDAQTRDQQQAAQAVGAPTGAQPTTQTAVKSGDKKK
jgi:hypothetical protein